MLYTVSQEINGEKLALIYGYETGDKFIGPFTLLSNKQIVNRIVNEGNVVTISSIASKPVLVLRSGKRSEIGKVVSAVYGELSKGKSFKDEYLINWAAKKRESGVVLSDECILDVNKNSIEFAKLLKGTSTFSNFNIDTSLIDDLNLRKTFAKFNIGSSSLPYIIRGNKTLLMERPDSLMQLRLPTIEECQLFYNEGTGMISPDLGEIVPKYPKPEYRKAIYEKHLDDGYDVGNIIGYSENNQLEIQENEKQLYNDIVELIKTSNKLNYPDKTIEQMEAEKIISKPVLEYLRELAKRISRINWQHVKNMPLGGLKEDSDEEGSDESSDFALFQSTDDVRIGEEFDSSLITNSDVILDSFISSMVKFNPYLLGELIVKLLRWGKRKPKKLRLDNFFNELNLNEFKLSSVTTSFSEGKLYEEDGIDTFIGGLITCNKKFNDLVYIKSLGLDTMNFNSTRNVLGVFTYQKSIAPDGTEIKRYTCYSLIELVQLLKGGNKIGGLVYDGTVKFVGSTITEISARDLVLMVSSPDNESYFFGHSPEIKKFLISVGAELKNYSLLNILIEAYDDSNLNTKVTTDSAISVEDFREKSLGGEYKSQIVTGTLYEYALNTSLSITSKIATLEDRLGKKIGIEDVLKNTITCMNNDRISGVFDKDEESTEDLQANMLQKMILNGNSTVEVKEEVEEVKTNSISLIDSISNIKEFHPVVSKGRKELMCYLGSYKNENGKLVNVIVKSDEIPDEKKTYSDYTVMEELNRLASTGKLNIRAILVERVFNLIMSDYLNINFNGAEPELRFSSKDCATTILTAFKKAKLIVS